MAFTEKEELYCNYIATHGIKEKVSAYKHAGYSVKMSNAAIQVQADKVFNKPKITLRIKELTKIANKIAEKKFTITVEQRLIWLKDIIEAGLGDYVDAQENKRKENLPAARSAIDTLNNMLGTDEENGSVKPVKVFVGVQDAS